MTDTPSDRPPYPTQPGQGPSGSYQAPGYQQARGYRLRQTADGQLRACLFSLEETDLRGPLRSGASDDDIAALARECVAAKWAGHRIGKADFVKPTRSMSMIGG